MLRVRPARRRLTRPVGVAAVEPAGSERGFDLSLLFVEPVANGKGVGRMLFEAAVAFVARQSGASLSLLANPLPAPFYRHLGAVRVGEAPSDAIPGRALPLFEYVISRAPAGE